MAEVFLATQRGPGDFERTVAVKRILPHLADIPQFLEMFLDEARLAAQLSHPNIAHIYEFGEVDDSYFIAMEYIDGVDLSSVVLDGPKRPLPLEHAARIAADVCAGLNHAHQLKGKGKQLGIVHRDISPQNILVSFDGGVKVVDFGIAKAAYHIERTKPGVVRGKFTYMSPEQVMGKNLDGRSDLFSLGIVLYELCTCEALFPRTNAVQAMQLIKKAEVPEPKRLNRRLPKQLTRILKRALAGDRDKRYQTGAEMQMDLEEYLRSTTQISNSILLGGYFAEHYRKLRPEPVEGEDHTAGVGGTKPAGTVPAVSAGPGTAPAANAGAEPMSGSAPTEIVLYSRPEALSEPDPEPPPLPPEEASGIIYRQPTAIKAEALDPDLQSTILASKSGARSYEHETVARTSDELRHPRSGPQRREDPSGGVGRGSRQFEEPAEIESPTVEFTPNALRITTGSGRALYPATAEAETPHSGPFPRQSQSQQVLAGTTLSVRRFGRRLVVAGLITAIAVAGVLAGYFISAPPSPTGRTAASPDVGGGSVQAMPPLPPQVPDAAIEAVLEVISDPSGASLTVDGQVIAEVTPVRRSFAPGHHVLVVSHPGYADQVQEVELAAGREMKVNFVLRRAESEKVVQLRQPEPPQPKPVGVQLKLRSKHKRKTRAKRRPKKRARKVRKVKRPVVKKPRPQPAPVRVEGPRYGYLFITTQPWSHVYLGRRKLGTTPLARIKVPVGTLRLFFTNPNHGEATRVVTVRPGQVVKLRFDL
jgi:serine/threonine-protein kinase